MEDMPRARQGDYHIGISTPGHNPSLNKILEHQQSTIRDLIEDWVGQKSAYIEPEGEFRVTRDIWVTPSTLQECLQLTHKRKFIVLHGITQEQVCNHNNSGFKRPTSSTQLSCESTEPPDLRRNALPRKIQPNWVQGRANKAQVLQNLLHSQEVPERITIHGFTALTMRGDNFGYDFFTSIASISRRQPTSTEGANEPQRDQHGPN